MQIEIRQVISTLRSQYSREAIVHFRFDLSDQLQTEIEIDSEKLTVETRLKSVEIDDNSLVIKAVNRENARNDIGGFVVSAGRLLYRTSSPFIKAEFPQRAIYSMLSLHQSTHTLSTFQSIIRQQQASSLDQLPVS